MNLNRNHEHALNFNYQIKKKTVLLSLAGKREQRRAPILLIGMSSSKVFRGCVIKIYHRPLKLFDTSTQVFSISYIWQSDYYIYSSHSRWTKKNKGVLIVDAKSAATAPGTPGSHCCWVFERGQYYCDCNLILRHLWLWNIIWKPKNEMDKGMHR